MHFRFTEEQELFRRSVAEFVDGEVVPKARALDEAHEFPHELFRKLGELGYFGARYPEDVGGSDAGNLCFALLVEELARGCLGLAAGCTMQSLMGTNFLHTFGTDDHRKRLLVPALRGEKIGTIAMTEPDFGSDLGGIQTTAVRDGDGWVLNGRKMWITGATVADFFTVAAKTDPEGGMKGIDLFLVERDMEGVQVGREIEKLGTWTQETSELALENVRVPGENLFGGQGSGAKLLNEVLCEIRIATGALGLGLARAALDASVRYAHERIQFGRPIEKFQAVAHRQAEMATELEAARWLVYRAAWGLDEGEKDVTLAAMAKLYATEVANRAADGATRIFGSYGFAMEYEAQRYYRDARFLLYGGGTSEILRTVIARGVQASYGG
jgi:butyryl-CoA dehydrogenase